MSTCPEITQDEAKFAVPAPPRAAWFAVARGGAMAVLDQAVVSGTNFLTVVLVGRACGQEELGYYSLGVTVLVPLLNGADERDLFWDHARVVLVASFGLTALAAVAALIRRRGAAARDRPNSS